MKIRLFPIVIVAALGLFNAQGQIQTNVTAGSRNTSTPPVNIQLSFPDVLAVTNPVTFKPDEQTLKILQRVGASLGTNPITIQLDSQSLAQLMQFSTNPALIQLDEATLAALQPRTEAWWKNWIPLFATLIGAVIAFVSSFWAVTHSHNLQIERKEKEDAKFVRNVLKSIEAELDALSEIFNQGIGGKLKAKKGRMFLVRLALSQDYFTVYGANAVHLGKIDADIAKAIISLYQTLKVQIEAFRINNEYIQMHDAVLYQLTTTFPLRPDGVVRRAEELDGYLNDQGDELVRLTGSVEAQYSALKEALKKLK